VDKEEARRISGILLSCSGELDRSVGMLQYNVDEKFFQDYRRKVGEIMGLLYIEILLDIYTEYPDLEPESFRD